jgi:hypothetical protein
MAVIAGLCLARAAVVVAVGASQFTLAWTHSIEKIRWEEDWRVTPAGLVIVEARIRGSGAGMDPPAGSRFAGGAWHYRPAIGPQREVVLAASGFTADHDLCVHGHCRPLHEWIAGRGPVTLSACPTPPRR